MRQKKKQDNDCGSVDVFDILCSCPCGGGCCGGD